jgi:N-acetylmuramoyl-L-alanine amidase
VLVGLVVAILAAGCSVGRASVEVDEATSTPPAPGDPGHDATSPAAVPPTSATPTTRNRRPLPAFPDDGVARAVITPTGVVAAVVAARSDGTFLVTSPCGNDVAVRGATPLAGAHVVLDPGHGGRESGAVGPAGLKESDLNLAVARRVQGALEAEGVHTVLTRTGDYRATLASRARVATALHAAAFVSIHHNAEPDHTQDTPGTEVYYQVGDERSSKRLAGLVYEETVAALGPFGIAWAAFRDAGVKVRLDGRGQDYYGILRNASGTPSALAELAYVTNPPEEALLATPAFQAVEAAALARAILRYLTTDDPGSGFVAPSDRTEPAGPGGGAQGCVDPPMQ